MTLARWIEVWFFGLATAMVRPGAADAQCSTKPCTVQEAIERATATHPLMDASRENVAVFEAKLMGAELTWAPVLQNRGLVTATPARTGTPAGGSTDYGEWGPFVTFEISGVIPLFTFGKLSLLKEMARHGVDASKAQLQIARSQVELLTVQAFYALEFSTELDGILDEGAKYLRQARDYLEKLRDADSPEYDDADMARLKVFEAEVDSRRLEVKRLRRLSLSGMSKLTGYPDESFLPAGKLKALEASLDELSHYLDLASSHRGELLALGSAVKAQAAKADLDGRWWLPDFFLAGFYNYAKAWVVEDQGSPFAYDPYNTAGGGAAVGVKLDLDFARQLSTLDESRATERKLSAQAAALKQQVELEVEKAWLEARDARENMDLNLKAFKAARGWVIGKLDLYESGFAELRDLTDALTEFFKRRIGYGQAMMDYNVSLARLAGTCGVPLFDLLGKSD